jgi:pimeloyl-ACP methyl ester carboxylesterase
MNTRLTGAGAALLVLFLISCVDAHSPTKPMNLPENLDAYLKDREAGIPGITPGSEKTIVWAGAPGVKTPFSIIYLHGFTATRQELAPVYDEVARAVGANIFYTRLTGHGMSGEALAAATLDDWVNDTREAYRIGERIGDRVIVAATSTGAPLALWLAALGAAGAAPRVAALVLASANVKPADPAAELLLWPWPVPNIVLGAFVGPVRTVPAKNEMDARYWTKRYPSKALVAMMATVKLGRSVALSAITVPSLWVYSDRDDVVSIPEMKKYYQRIGSTKKRLVEIPGAAGHVLAGSILSPATTGDMVTLVSTFLKESVIAGSK